MGCPGPENDPTNVSPDGCTLTINVLRCPVGATAISAARATGTAYMESLIDDLPEDLSVPENFPENGPENSHEKFHQCLKSGERSQDNLKGANLLSHLIEIDDDFRTSITDYSYYDGSDVTSIIWHSGSNNAYEAFYRALANHKTIEEFWDLQTISASGKKIEREIRVLYVSGPGGDVDSLFGANMVTDSGGSENKAYIFINVATCQYAANGTFQNDLFEQNNACGDPDENGHDFIFEGAEMHELAHLITNQRGHHNYASCCVLTSFEDMEDGKFSPYHLCWAHWSRARNRLMFDEEDLGTKSKEARKFWR